ncbi:GntR family transcriptional regulator [Streptomyces canus]|uniref:GntR family transcriptional regulator n=1 Tax=Streptomyces canus TaxID=58343 RepID=UPI0034107B49
MARADARQPAAKDKAYAFVKRQVLRGEYPGGELISEGEVSEALGMSRTPVREAFLRLEVEGLLRLYPQRGALVVPVSSEEVQAVLEARSLLERFAVEKVVEGSATARQALLGTLREHLERQRSLAAEDETEAFLEEDRLFHAALLGAAGNVLLNRFYGSLRERQVRMTAVSVLTDEGRRETILAEHAEIAEAVGAGDLERARTAVLTHLASTRTALGFG